MACTVTTTGISTNCTLGGITNVEMEIYSLGTVANQPGGTVAGTLLGTAIGLNETTPLVIANQTAVDINGSISGNFASFTINRITLPEDIQICYRITDACGTSDWVCDTAWACSLNPFVFGTGVDDNNTLVPLGTLDPHWTLTSNPHNPGNPNTYVASNPPPGVWYPQQPSGQWITADPTSYTVQGATNQDYHYAQTVDLSGFDETTARFYGKWSSDNTGSMYINGNFITSWGDYTGFTTFDINTGWVPGINTIEVRIDNPVDGSPNPSGFIMFETIFTVQPLPATLPYYCPPYVSSTNSLVEFQKACGGACCDTGSLTDVLIADDDFASGLPETDYTDITGTGPTLDEGEIAFTLLGETIGTYHTGLGTCSGNPPPRCGNRMVVANGGPLTTDDILRWSVTLQANKCYQLSLWVYNLCANGIGRPDFTLWFNDTELIASSGPIENDLQWHQISYEVCDPLSGPATFHLRNTNSIAGGNDFQIDCIELNEYDLLPGVGNTQALSGFDISVSDPNWFAAEEIASATVVLNKIDATDELVVGTLPAGITSNKVDNATTTTITLTGPALPADFDTAINNIEFITTGSTTNVTRDITVSAIDSDGLSSPPFIVQLDYCGCNPCGVITGGCCDTATGSCSVTTQAACADTYLGDGTDCSTCFATGGCCNLGTGSCTITTQAACADTYLGDGTDCSTCIPPPTGQQQFTTPGTFNWTAPAGVTSVSVVAVGAGGAGGQSSSGEGGGGGGGLGWRNNIAVVPGNNYTVVVGAGGVSTGTAGTNGGDSYFISLATVSGRGGNGSPGSSNGGAGGTFTGDGGGNGGNGAFGSTDGGGGGGAGGYTGNGGNGGPNEVSGSPGNGGGGGGGASAESTPYGGGGGVGIIVQGASGAGGVVNSGSGNEMGKGGSGGANGTNNFPNYGRGGLYGGGGSGSDTSFNASYSGGGGGAVRIIWGPGRSYPNNSV